MSLELDTLTDDEQDRLKVIFNAGAARVKVLDEHWINGHDEGLSYCYECCKKKLSELLKEEPLADYSVDGGWCTEGDGTPFCETCGARLSNTLTQYACEENVRHFIDNGFDPTSDDDCYEMDSVISSAGWHCYDFLHETEYEKKKGHDFYAALYTLGRSILAKIANQPKSTIS